MADSIQQAYVSARAALLDALEALGPHRQALILVGAQAIYLHTGEGEFSVSPFTYDADLAIDPTELADEPRIIELMRQAGFHQTDQPGIYRKADGTEVDLLVPEALSGPGRRGARLGAHGSRAAMKVYGLEGVVVDHGPRLVSALEPRDQRTYAIEVAGPAALLVAKLHKVGERIGQRPHRQDHKDAFDIYRILRAISRADLVASLSRLRHDPRSAAVTAEALELLREHFCTTEGRGLQMVVRHVEGLEDPAFIAASCVALSRELLSAVDEAYRRPGA